MSRAAPSLVLLMLSVVGCGLNPEVNGVWRTEDGEVVSWAELEFEGRVELVLGQYGDAVAGALRLFEKDQDFKEPFIFPDCPCLFLERASFDDGVLVFDLDLTRCGGDVGEWSGRFEWSENDGGVEILTGALEPKDPEGTGASTQTFVLRYSGGNKKIKEDELNQECLGPLR